MRQLSPFNTSTMAAHTMIFRFASRIAGLAGVARFAVAPVALARGVVVVALASASPASSHEVAKAGITVAHPWARATPSGATVGAAYLEIKSAAGTTDRLVAASSPVAGRTEIHTHIHEGNVMKMRRIEGLDVKSGSSVVLKPAGDHIMLMELKAPLKEGDLVPITLQFEKAGVMTIDATVEPVGALGPHGMDHQPGHEADKQSGGGHADHGKHRPDATTAPAQTKPHSH